LLERQGTRSNPFLLTEINGGQISAELAPKYKWDLGRTTKDWPELAFASNKVQFPPFGWQCIDLTGLVYSGQSQLNLHQHLKMKMINNKPCWPTPKFTHVRQRA